MSDIYWANIEDPHELAKVCMEKVTRFFHHIRQSPKTTRAIRSWAFYHGFYFESGDYTWSSVKTITGDDDAVAVNHYRNLIQHVLSLATQHRPATKSRARNSDTASLEQAKIGDNVSEHYMRERRLEDFFYKACEHALVLSEGYVYNPWDGNEGALKPDPEGRTEKAVDAEGDPIEIPIDFIREGDISSSNPTLFDVVSDYGLRDWERRQWVMVRTWENKWDLAARLEKESLVDEADIQTIREFSLGDVDLDGEFVFGRYADMLTEEDSDIIPVWNVHHIDSDGCPGGLLFRFASSGIPLMEPEDNPYDDGRAMPLERCVPGESIFTTDGYTMAFDLQPVQQLINTSMSTLSTNLKATGYAAIAVPQGWDLEEEHLDRGVFLVRQRNQGNPTPPTGLNLTGTQRHHIEHYNMLVQSAEYISGVNSVARGQPEANLESGEALKVMDSKAVQFSHGLTNSYYKLIERSMTTLVRTVRDMMGEDDERKMSIFGEDNFSKVGHFRKEHLRSFDRLEVEAASPLSKTTSGRLAIGQDLINMGFVRTPEEYLTVLQTGQLKKALRADDAELSLIHDENDKIREGRPVEVDRMQDYHALHIREHKALLDSVDAKDSELYQHVQAHNMQHLEALVDPDVQYMQAALGFNVPVPALPTQPAGAPPGAVPGGSSKQASQGDAQPPRSQTGQKNQPASAPAGGA